MKRFMNKKVAAIGLAAGLALGAAGGAFAYFSSTGGGTGSVTTAGASNTLKVTDNSASLTAPGPGVAAQNLIVTVSNTSTTASVYVHSVAAYLTVAPATGAPAGAGPCTTADYLLNGTASTSATNTVAITGLTPVELIPSPTAGDSTSTTGTGNSIAFNDSATVDQSNCEGAVVTINYVAS
jgi:hypothetical protein